MITMAIGLGAGVFYWLGIYKLAFWILVYAIVYGGLSVLRGETRVAGPAMAGQAKDAHHLADRLGDDHDLGVLQDALAHGRVHAPVDLDAVVGLIVHRRLALQTEA